MKVLESFFDKSNKSSRLSAEFLGPLRQSDGTATYTMYICRSQQKNVKLYRISFTQEVGGKVTYGYGGPDIQNHPIKVTNEINAQLVKLLSDLLFCGIITNINTTDPIKDQQVCLFLNTTRRASKGAARGKQPIPTVQPFMECPYYELTALLSKTLCDLSIASWVAGNNNEEGQVHFLLTFDRTAAQVSSLLENMDKHTLLQSKNTLYYMDFVNVSDDRFIQLTEANLASQSEEIRKCVKLH